MKFRKVIAALLVAGITVTSIASVPAFAKTLTDAHGNQVEIDESLQAYSYVTLEGADNAARKGETNLGDLWTDALLWFAKSGEIDKYYDEDDIAAGNAGISKDAAGIVALWNGGNLKSDIAVGTFGAEQLMSVLPYPNKVAVVYMTGAELVEALEAASQGLPYTEETSAACASFMQIAGAEYIVNTAKAYDGGEDYGKSWKKANSLGRVTVTSVNGKAFDSKATYAIITSNANFNGMDSSYIFKAAAAKNEASTITSAVVRDVVWMYMERELSNVVTDKYAKSQGRIKVLVADEKGSFEYTVQRGDSLWKISKMFLGYGYKWETIYEANKSKIANPRVIFRGQKFVIPGVKEQ